MSVKCDADVCVQLRCHSYSDASVIWLIQSVEHETLITGS